MRNGDAHIALRPFAAGGFGNHRQLRCFPVNPYLGRGGIGDIAGPVDGARFHIGALLKGDGAGVGLPVFAVYRILGAQHAAERVPAIEDGEHHIAVMPVYRRGLPEGRSGGLLRINADLLGDNRGIAARLVEGAHL